MNGVLVVDKERGPTSHDIVARVRRVLGTRSVGHAGTLDPRATGALVIAVGEATKLVAYLTADDKSYEAEVTVGVETDSLDADGAIVRRCAVPAGLTVELVERASRQFVGRRLQRAPLISAIKVAGRPLHARVRRGEAPEAPEREVELRALRVISVAGERIRLDVECGKGFYVRALARDLGEALHSCAHLSSLRRVRSGTFDLGRAVASADLEAYGADALRRHMVPLRQAWDLRAAAVLTEDGVRLARHGRLIGLDAIIGAPPDPETPGVVGLFDSAGPMVAIAKWEGLELRVVRGILDA